MYYYVYDPAEGIPVPEPYKRVMTPFFMGDDPDIHGVGFSIHFTEWEPGCAVAEAAVLGEISRERLERYKLLLAEAKEVWRERYD